MPAVTRLCTDDTRTHRWKSVMITMGYAGDGDGERRVWHLPNNESNPQAIHIIKLTPMEPVRTSKPDGDTKIPDPRENGENWDCC